MLRLIYIDWYLICCCSIFAHPYGLNALLRNWSIVKKKDWFHLSVSHVCVVNIQTRFSFINKDESTEVVGERIAEWMPCVYIRLLPHPNRMPRVSHASLDYRSSDAEHIIDLFQLWIGRHVFLNCGLYKVFPI